MTAGRALLAALALGFGLALVVAGPDLPGLTQGLPGRLNDDGLHAIYLHHQVHDALAAGRLDLSDPHQLWPVGAPLLRINGGNILEMLVSGLTRVLLPFPAWLSAAALLWVPLNLLAFVPLGRALWGRDDLALAGGAAWAVSPVLLAQLGPLRLTQVALVGLPLAVLGLWRIAETGGRRSALLAGGGMALLGYGYWFYAAMLTLCVPAFLAYGRRQGRPLGAQLRDLAAAGALSAILAAPLLGQIVAVVLQGEWMPPPPLSAEFASPVFDDALRIGWRQPDGLRGWWPVILIPGALWAVRTPGRGRLWAACAGICVVFALGPAQDLLGARWLLPSYPLWRWAPGFDRMHHPDRWMAIASLFLVLLSVDGLRRVRPRAAWALPVGVLAQAWLAGPLPLGTWTPEAPAHWQAVAQQAPAAGPGAVIVLPLLRAPNTSAWQHLHGRPLLGGMVENQPWFLPPDFRTFLGTSPLLHDLWDLTHGQRVAPTLWQADLDQLHAAGFSLLVLDRRAWTRHPPSGPLDPEPWLRRSLGEPLYTGSSGAIWALPAEGRPGPLPDRGPLALEGPPDG